MTILKGIPPAIPPALLYILARMGHGDELVIADANFPAESVAAQTPAGIVRCDAMSGSQVLQAVLQVRAWCPHGSTRTLREDGSLLRIATELDAPSGVAV